MKIVISTSIDKPLHAQIEECVQAEILSGNLKGNEPLPSIRQLAAELKVSVITVKNAYETLQNEGYIYSFPSKGFYVADLDKNKIEKIKASILKKTMAAQLSYLNSLGISQEDVLALLEKEKLSK